VSRIACRDDWQTLPCPEEREWFDLSLALTPDEARLVQAGFVPRGSDDRWFLFVEEGTLYCHRSWTGECIFGACLEWNGEAAAITQAIASTALMRKITARLYSQLAESWGSRQDHLQETPLRRPGRVAAA